MKAGKLANQLWMICQYNENTLVDLPSSVMAPAKKAYLLIEIECLQKGDYFSIQLHWFLNSVCIYICKFEVGINEIRNFYKFGAKFQNTPLSIIGQFFGLMSLGLDYIRKMIGKTCIDYP